MTMNIANVQITTALQGVTVRYLKACIEKVEEDYKEKAVLVEICLYMDCLRSKKATARWRRSFEEALAENVDDG
jgi:hypothetical protein